MLTYVTPYVASHDYKVRQHGQRISVSAPKNPTGEKYKIIYFNPVYEKVKIYRESDYESSQGV